MFRKPRESDLMGVDTPVKPSTGRAPTPPNGPQSERDPSTTTMITRNSSTKPLTSWPNPNVSMLGRQGPKKVAYSRTPAKQNGSILNFFKKVDSQSKDDGALFLSQGSSIVQNNNSYNVRSPSPNVFDDIGVDPYSEVDGSEDRYNESMGSVKRRKVDNGSDAGRNDISGRDRSATGNSASAEYLEATIDTDGPDSTTPINGACTPPLPPDTTVNKSSTRRRIGPFLDDSESEDEGVNVEDVEVFKENHLVQTVIIKAEELELDPVALQSAEINELVTTRPVNQEEMVQNLPAVPEIETPSHVNDEDATAQADGRADAGNRWEEATGLPNSVIIPSLKNEITSFDEYGEFDDVEDFPEDDEFADGEELAERKWMEEQAMLEATENGFGEEYPGDGFDVDVELTTPEEVITPSCPICEAKLGGLNSDQVTRHVNACLDGNPLPIPASVKVEARKTKIMPSSAGSRFSRAGIARPGQANPFNFGNTEAAPSSAFSKLMSSHAEDAAWASAAAAEYAARGKPAYQRTCPFYKIMPGFYICVDAFRYGAVQGCNAYFLSHFHSDHYIGLTSTWSHGPIYCSKVTANLVKQQLRVDPKWVVPLNFETRFEVPETQGVVVTMIPANHCPGSSLFLFEKVVGKGANPKIQRVLHCGDFRACTAHIAHPLLMPDIVDSITGKTKQQKIDVCYLDTTYLNPRYAFPSQDDVIKACADMCVSLRKERAEESDAWEMVKKERAGTGMAKFIDTSVKAGDNIAIEVDSTQTRGRLLVICGTYSIGKERICMGIARALDCKIWAPPGKRRICAALEDPELSSRLTDDPREAQIHMQMLMEIRAETLQDYLNGFKPHFSRVVGFRPSGWNYRPPNSRFVESPAVQTVLMSENWKSRYTMAELVPQRGSTREASCFGVPYSEHSSFRELTIFCCALRIEKFIPTVNVGSGASRAKMKSWIERWIAERRKNGVVRIGDGQGEVRW